MYPDPSTSHDPPDHRRLNIYRAIGDPPADTAIAQACAERPVHQLLPLLSEEEPERWPAPLIAFHEAVRIDCSRADRKLAESLFAQHGPELMVSLCCSALPTDYLNARGAKVLTHTGALTDKPHRRLASTAQLVVDILCPGGLGPRGPGRLAVVRARLVHAALRVILRGADAGGPCPINQEDLAYAFVSFTTLVIDGIRRLGCRPSPEQIDAYFRVWSAVGPALGMLPALVPPDEVAAYQLYKSLRSRQTQPGDDARDLTHALVETIDSLLPETQLAGGSDLLRVFLGADDAASLQVNTSRRLLGRHPKVGALFLELGLLRPLVRNLAVSTLGNLGRRESFHIPAAVLRNWSANA